MSSYHSRLITQLSWVGSANTVRKSSLRNISLRHNRINATGAVAIALMIRDYPDRYPAANGNSNPTSPTASSPVSPFSSPPSTPSLASHISLPSTDGTVTPPLRAGPLPPPPRHPQTGPHTTYTPYVPRSKRAPGVAAFASANPLSPTGQQIPIITSSAQGGVTTRHPVPPVPISVSRPHGQGAPQHYDHGPSAALLDKVRALDSLPRLGALRTLDLRGNDIRVSRMCSNFIPPVLQNPYPVLTDWHQLHRASA